MANHYVLEVEKPLMDLERQIEEFRRLGEEQGIDVAEETGLLQGKLEAMRQEVYRNLTEEEARAEAERCLNCRRGNKRAGCLARNLPGLCKQTIPAAIGGDGLLSGRNLRMMLAVPGSVEHDVGDVADDGPDKPGPLGQRGTQLGQHQRAHHPRK